MKITKYIKHYKPVRHQCGIFFFYKVKSLEDGLSNVPVPSDRNDLSYFKKLNNVICYIVV